MELQPCCNFNAISCWLCADPKISKFFFFKHRALKDLLYEDK